MVALQASIGALNDLLDVPLDRGRKPGKPIPAGLVPPAAAAIVVVGGAIIGGLLSWASGWMTAGLAVAILAVGYAYDGWFKGTAWSWLPFAIGIPLLPVYAWAGAAGVVPAQFTVLVPCAGLAGAALAIANSLADVERDSEAGVTSVARRLGYGAAWALHAGLHGVVLVVALATLPVLGTVGPGAAVAALGSAVILAGVAAGRGRGPEVRERAWELEAVGVAILGAGWLAAVPLR
jgi:4-hydroxybenzoate polyprenyltransferase